MKKRRRLCISCSHDQGARIGVLVAELRGDPHRYWERVVHGPSSTVDPMHQLEFALSVVGETAITDLDIFMAHRWKHLPLQIPSGMGHLRVRWIAHRKNQGAHGRARARLCEIVPRPLREEDSYSLADLGVDLEIAGFEEAAASAAGDEQGL